MRFYFDMVKLQIPYLMNKKTSLPKQIVLMLFGLFLTIVILEIVLRISGFTILSLQEYSNLQSIRQKGSFRIMCLGESTTQNQYPLYLEEILNQHSLGIKFSVIDKGITSIKTTAILSHLEENLDKYQPDIVITMMGCNDGKGVMYYKDMPEANTWLFQHCRAYRFIRLIYVHILNKLKKESLYGLDDPSLSRKTKSDSKGYKKDAGREDIYQNNKELIEKEQALKKTIELNRNNQYAYIELVKFYENQGKSEETEQLLKKAIELNPKNGFAYVILGWLYENQEKFSESEQLFKKAIELNPKNGSAYKELGKLYRDQRKSSESEQAFRKVIEFNPNNDSVYKELGKFYIDQGKLSESEQAFKKAVELNPKNDFAYVGLGKFYIDQGRFTEAKQLFKKAVELNPGNDSLYGGLATIYCEIGNNELSEIYAKKADSLRDEYPDPKAISNYRTLKQILDKRKIKLVCVQYPMRNIAPLKKIFKEEVEGSIIFVDNERIFKNAVRKESYKEYFRDMFGGDFGHCTDKGNKLLAENIANVILKEIFDK